MELLELGQERLALAPAGLKKYAQPAPEPLGPLLGPLKLVNSLRHRVFLKYRYNTRQHGAYDGWSCGQMSGSARRGACGVVGDGVPRLRRVECRRIGLCAPGYTGMRRR